MDNRLDIVNVNGTELKYSWFDMAMRKKYIKAAEKYAKAINDLNEGLPETFDENQEIDYYTRVCEFTFAFFDETFGKGTADKVFGGLHDFIVCSEAVHALKNSRLKQQKYVEQLSVDANVEK